MRIRGDEWPAFVERRTGVAKGSIVAEQTGVERRLLDLRTGVKRAEFESLVDRLRKDSTIAGGK